MSSAANGNAVADGTVVVTTASSGSDEHGMANSSGGNGGGGSKGQLTLTPRFTQEEKEILYSLFHQHEEVIDIKYRKKQRSKYSVRDVWEQIVREFNSHPGISAVRNLKQIQKFWLNARLRKQYPFRGSGQKGGSGNSGGGSGQQQMVNHAIKDEPDFQLTNNETPEHNSHSESFEEIEMDTSGVGQLEEDPIETQPAQQQHHQQQLQQHVQQQQHQQQPTTIQTQQISVDQISADKLTLNDLLQFKTRPREDIILQIKHPSEATTAQITIPSPTRITIPTHQAQQHTMATITTNGYNQQIISEIKPQQITLAQYQAQQLQQQQQQQLAQQQLVAAQQQQQQQQQQQHQQVKMQLQSPAPQQFATATPTFTCTTFNALPVATAAPAATVTATTANAASVMVENFEEKINYFKLKEAELRFKEEQVALEKKKIELNRAQDELKHIREVHRLQVEELKIKIRILQEEEKMLQKNQSGMAT